jgi:hypothetical protein
VFVCPRAARRYDADEQDHDFAVAVGRVLVVAMILEVHEPPEYVPLVVATDPDRMTIETVVRSLAWADITFVILKIDDNNWIEGSGSLSPQDGLSARYMEDGQEFVSSRPPDSLQEIIDLLDSFRLQDGRGKNLIGWE